MPKEIMKIVAEERKGDFGSAGSRRVVRSGRIPCVVYGQSEPCHFTIDAHEFSKIRKRITRTTLIDLKIGERELECLLKDFQEDIIAEKMLHLDFYEIKRGKLLTAKVKIVLKGNPIGVREGGVLEQIMHEAEIECLPRNLPEVIEVDVTELGANEAYALSRIPAIEGVRFLDDPESTVATIRFAREEVGPSASEEVAAADAAASASDAVAEADKAKK